MNISKISHMDCTGCSACVSICPVDCIQMEQDKEMFLYPRVDEGKCIDCGRCMQSCPVEHPVKLTPNRAAFAVSALAKKETQKSSSGGAFYLLAKHVICDLHGVVCGAVLKNDLQLRHELAFDLEGVRHMQGSKYMQSDLGDCFCRIRDLLKKQRFVLFSGTPCQTAGLRNFLGRDDEKLFLADIICHGVPSNLAFRRFMQERFHMDGFEDFSFRQKNKYSLASYSYSFKVEGRKKNMLIYAEQDPTYSAFLEGYNYRECCYHCPYATKNRVGDITLGDCANSAAYKELRGQTISSVLIHSHKGEALWEYIKEEVNLVSADYEAEVKKNKQLHRCVQRPKQRETYYSDLQSLSFCDLRRKYCLKQGIKARIKNLILRTVPVSTRLRLKSIIRRERWR